jgi:hypothetical protein
VASDAVLYRVYHRWSIWRSKPERSAFEAVTDITKLLAFAIAKMDGIAGYGGWRYTDLLSLRNHLLT